MFNFSLLLQNAHARLPHSTFLSTSHFGKPELGVLSMATVYQPCTNRFINSSCETFPRSVHVEFLQREGARRKRKKARNLNQRHWNFWCVQIVRFSDHHHKYYTDIWWCPRNQFKNKCLLLCSFHKTEFYHHNEKEIKMWNQNRRHWNTKLMKWNRYVCWAHSNWIYSNLNVNLQPQRQRQREKTFGWTNRHRFSRLSIGQLVFFVRIDASWCVRYRTSQIRSSTSAIKIHFVHVVLTV